MSLTSKIAAATALVALAGSGVAAAAGAPIVGAQKTSPNGSIVDHPRVPRRGEQPGRVCASRAYLYRSPGRTFAGTVFREQPLSIQRRSASGRRARVVTDAHTAGRLKASALCR